MTSTTKKKYVEQELQDDLSLPTEEQTITKVVKSCGNNLHLVTTADGKEFLASMPHKFRKHVWIKRGDYVIVEEIPEGNKVKGEIVKILFKDHIMHLKENNVWPTSFIEEKLVESSSNELDVENLRISSESDSELFKNPNRRQIFYSESDSSSSEFSVSDNDNSNKDL